MAEEGDCKPSSHEAALLRQIVEDYVWWRVAEKEEKDRANQLLALRKVQGERRGAVRLVLRQDPELRSPFTLQLLREAGLAGTAGLSPLLGRCPPGGEDGGRLAWLVRHHAEWAVATLERREWKRVHERLRSRGNRRRTIVSSVLARDPTLVKPSNLGLLHRMGFRKI